jgi:NAD(P)-dependent dehydrogenase (short-subunit alcohol dehydrogenase family)
LDADALWRKPRSGALKQLGDIMKRRVLVTAGAAGIGKEIAAAFLSAGDAVYTCDINQAALDAAAGELKV